MAKTPSAKPASLESVDRIEPLRLEDPSEAIIDVVAELAAAFATLGPAPYPSTAARLAEVVRIVNAYSSHLIEGLTTQPKDAEGFRDRSLGERMTWQATWFTMVST